jgi:hypothetical protein
MGLFLGRHLSCRRLLLLLLAAVVFSFCRLKHHHTTHLVIVSWVGGMGGWWRRRRACWYLSILLSFIIYHLTYLPPRTLYIFTILFIFVTHIHTYRSRPCLLERSRPIANDHHPRSNQLLTQYLSLFWTCVISVNLIFPWEL